MPRSLTILNQDEWFLREEQRDSSEPGYPIYYRYAISYSIAQTILQGKDQAWVANELNKLLTSMEKKEAYSSKDFIEIYPLAEDKGYVLVDQTDSWYPLIFYSPSEERPDSQRDGALTYSLNDIKNGLDQIYEKLSGLKKMDNWTPKFQQDLYALFPYNQ